MRAWERREGRFLPGRGYRPQGPWLPGSPPLRALGVRSQPAVVCTMQESLEACGCNWGVPKGRELRCG